MMMVSGEGDGEEEREEVGVILSAILGESMGGYNANDLLFNRLLLQS